MHGDPLADDPSFESLFDHVTREFGPIKWLFHPRRSGLVHLDVAWVPPNRRRHCHTLVTCGMSQRPMAPPDEARDLRFAELFLSLPRDWPSDLDSLRDIRHGWPLGLLGDLGLLPHETESWLWHAHTVGPPEPWVPFAPGTRLGACLIGARTSLRKNGPVLRLPTGRTIYYWNVIPLYKEELSLALRFGSRLLIEMLHVAGVREVIDVRRGNLMQLGKW